MKGTDIRLFAKWLLVGNVMLLAIGIMQIENKIRLIGYGNVISSICGIAMCIYVLRAIKNK